MADIADLADFFNSQVPWAKEATLEMIETQSKRTAATLTAALRKMGTPIDINGIARLQQQQQGSFKRIDKAVAAQERIFSTMQRDTDPLTATAELMYSGAKVIDGVIDNVSDFTGKFGIFGKIASGTAETLSGLAVGVAGVTSVMSIIMTEQEKTIRGMIDFGLMSSSLEYYDVLRKSAARSGMSLSEMGQTVSAAGGMMVQVGGTKDEGFKKLTKYAGTINTMYRETSGDFGYTVEELTKRLVEEADMLYQLGELETSQGFADKRILEGFKKSSAMATAMAGLTGEERASLLALRQQALTNIDMRSALIQNAEFIAKQFGEDADDRIAEANATSFTIANTLFGPAFADMMQNSSNNMLKNISLDQTIVNDLPESMVGALALLGPEVQNQFIDIMDKQNKGLIAGDDLVMAWQGLAKKVAKARPTEGFGEDIEIANNLISMARIAPDGLMNVSAEAFKARLAEIEARTEQADGAIDSLDNLRVAFRTVVDAITPSNSTSGAALEMFSETLEAAGYVIGKAFGIEVLDPRERAKQVKQKLDTQKQDAKVLNEQVKLMLEYENQGNVLNAAQQAVLDRNRRQKIRNEQLENAEVFRKGAVVNVIVKEELIINKTSAADYTMQIIERDGEKYRVLRPEFFDGPTIDERRDSVLSTYAGLDSSISNKVSTDIESYISNKTSYDTKRSEYNKTDDPKKLLKLRQELADLDAVMVEQINKINEKIKTINAGETK